MNTAIKHQITAAHFDRYQFTDRVGKQQMADELGLTYDGLRGTISKWRAARQHELPVEPAIDSAIPRAMNLITEQPLELDFDRWAYASDFHAPLHNERMVDRLARVIRKREIPALIIGGDLYDLATLSKHPQIHKAPSTDDTIRVAGDLLVYLAGLVDQLVIMPGNHCLRLAKTVSGLDFANLVWAGVRGRVSEQKLLITNFDYVFVGPEETGWVCGHPRYFSSFPAKGGADVADLKHRSVIGAHNHIQGLVRSKSGRYLSIDPGHMTDPRITPYHLQGDGLSKYPAWVPGFVVIDRNIPTLFDDGKLVDWATFA